MTKKTRPTYDQPFRLEVVKLVADDGYTIREAAETMNVGKSTVDKWVREYRAGCETGKTVGAPVSDEQARIRALEKENKRLKEDNEILKKASALLISDSIRYS
jgi:transposase